MAEGVDQLEISQIICPICLDSFKKPTLLRCGHTFCKICLEKHDEAHSNRLIPDLLECPVCRKRTKLDENRISGLSSNYALIGMRDELQDNSNSGFIQKKCILHKTEAKNIFCEACKTFICISCFIKDHQGHNITKREILEEEMREKRASLIQEGKIRKLQVEQSLNEAQQQRGKLNQHIDTMQMAIVNASSKKINTIQENTKRLLETLGNIKRDAYKQSDDFIAHQRRLLSGIKFPGVLLEQNVSQFTDDECLIKHYLCCVEFEKSLKKPSVVFSTAEVQAALQSKFCCAGSKKLDIGFIEHKGTAACSDTFQGPSTSAGINIPQGTPMSEGLTNEQTTLTTGANAPHLTKEGGAASSSEQTGTNAAETTSIASEPLSPTCQEVDVPAVARQNNRLTVVKDIPMSSYYEMAALSADTVVVSYKSSSECISVSGERRVHLNQPTLERKLCGIAFLADGRTVASGFDSACRIYDAQGLASMRYICKQSCAIRTYPKICTDQHDNIYTVNGYPEISIFSGLDPNPQRIINTNLNRPYSIDVTSSGAMIVCSNVASKSVYPRRTVTVYDRNGNVGTSIKSNNVMSEKLYAAVDSQDRVLIARLRTGTDFLRLARYTLDGVTLTREVGFRLLQLPRKIDPWCCMVSLSPDLVAIADSNHLYFIHIAM